MIESCLDTGFAEYIQIKITVKQEVSYLYTVFIAADMEGITGYVNWPEKPPEDSWFREQMTAEVNAAIEGSLAGGAGDVIVSDIHWRKQNIIPDKMSGNARLIRGSKRRLMWMDMVERCNMVILIGFHAGSGSAGAVLPHTIDTRIVRLTINDMVAGEAMLSALAAGYYEVPVGMVTGDRACINETRLFLPDVKTVVVKEAIGNCAALGIHPVLAVEKIRVAAMEATKRGLEGGFKPFQTREPVDIVMEFSWPVYAEALSLVPGVTRTGGRMVSYRGGWLDAVGIISLFINWVENMPGL